MVGLALPQRDRGQNDGGSIDVGSAAACLCGRAAPRRIARYPVTSGESVAESMGITCLASSL